MEKITASQLKALRGEITFAVHKVIAEEDHFWSDEHGKFFLSAYDDELYNYNKAVQLAFVVGGSVVLVEKYTDLIDE